MIINRVSLYNFNGNFASKKSEKNNAASSVLNYNKGFDTIEFRGLSKSIQEAKTAHVQKKLGDAIEPHSTLEAIKVLDYFGIEHKLMPDGFIKIKGDYPYSYENDSQDKNRKKPSDYGVDENKLFQFIEKVDGSVFFNETNITSTGALKSIRRDAYLEDSKVSRMPNLEYVGRNLYASYTTELKTLGNIEYIGGMLDVVGSDVEDFGKVRYVGKSVLAKNSKVKNLGQIETIGGCVSMDEFDCEDLSNLKHVKGNIYFMDSKVKNADSLVFVGGIADFSFSDVESAKNLSFVEEKLKLGSSKIKEFPNLAYVGDDMDASKSGLSSAPKLSYIGGNLYLGDTSPVDLGSLKYIGGIVSCSGDSCMKDKFDDVFIKTKYTGSATSNGMLVFDKTGL